MEDTATTMGEGTSLQASMETEENDTLSEEGTTSDKKRGKAKRKRM